MPQNQVQKKHSWLITTKVATFHPFVQGKFKVVIEPNLMDGRKYQLLQTFFRSQKLRQVTHNELYSSHKPKQLNPKTLLLKQGGQGKWDQIRKDPDN